MSSPKNVQNTIEAEHENLAIELVPSGPEISSEFPTVETREGVGESTRNVGRTAVIIIIVVLCLACLIVGAVLVLTAFKQCKNVSSKSSTAEENTCSPSTEAQRVKLFELFKKVQEKYFELHPNYVIMDQSAHLGKIKQVFQAYDFSPLAIQKRTDCSMALLDELNNLKVDEQKLKPRENKLLSQMKFFLKHSFGQPYDGNYYSGGWMLGPNFFCWQPICILGDYELATHLPLFAPKTITDIKRLEALFKSYKRSIHQYQENLKTGVKAGMVQSTEECMAGLDAFKGSYKQIDLKNGSGVLDQRFASIVFKPEFYKNLSNSTEEEWRQTTGKSVRESVREFLVVYVGQPLKELMRYLGNEHMQHCIPGNVSSGLANRPLTHIYVNGIPTAPATRSLPTGERIYGNETYSSILSFFTTTDVTPNEVHEMGWQRVKNIYQQMVSIAKQVTKLTNVDLAVKTFRSSLRSQSMYFNSAPLPKNESGMQAYINCSDIEGARKYCPLRWKVLEKWFKTSEEIMSTLDPKTVDMFYFTGQKHTTPNCPVKLVPDFNPSSAAQSYLQSGPMCTKPCQYNVPFFLDNMGPKYSEWSVNAHEARPGHHTQAQGYEEHFRDSCGGVSAWLNSITVFTAFSEGWGLYAENLIAQDTDSYEGQPLKQYGWLKWQMWRSLRLVVDTGLHVKGMTRKKALQLFDQYAWDNTDISAKEVTRYQSGPGQATAYMIGEMTISKLRREAEAKLKNKFDLKDFHYQVLSQGSAPLSFLISHINHYITCKLNSTTNDVCQNMSKPPNTQPSSDLIYRTFGDITVDLSSITYSTKRYA